MDFICSKGYTFKDHSGLLYVLKSMYLHLDNKNILPLFPKIWPPAFNSLICCWCAVHMTGSQPQHTHQCEMILIYKWLPLCHFLSHSQCEVALELSHLLTDSSNSSEQWPLGHCCLLHISTTALCGSIHLCNHLKQIHMASTCRIHPHATHGLVLLNCTLFWQIFCCNEVEFLLDPILSSGP